MSRWKYEPGAKKKSTHRSKFESVTQSYFSQNRNISGQVGYQSKQVNPVTGKGENQMSTFFSAYN